MRNESEREIPTSEDFPKTQGLSQTVTVPRKVELIYQSM